MCFIFHRLKTELLKFWYFFSKTEYNVSDHTEKYFSFLVYGEMPSSAVVGQNYSFTVDVDLSGVAFLFQQDVTASDSAIPQAVCILYTLLWNRTMKTNVVRLFICSIISGFPSFFFTARKSNSESVAVYFHDSPRRPRNN